MINTIMNAYSSQLLPAVIGAPFISCQAEWCGLGPKGSYQLSHFRTQTKGKEVPVWADSFWPFDQALSEVIHSNLISRQWATVFDVGKVLLQITFMKGKHQDIIKKEYNYQFTWKGCFGILLSLREAVNKF